MLGSPELPDNGSIDDLDKVKPLDLIHCPSVPKKKASNNYPITLTYGMNGLNPTNAWWARLIASGDQFNAVPQVKTMKVVKPEGFGVLTEYWNSPSPHQSAWATVWWRLYIANEMSFKFTHGKYSNVLLSDGHVGNAKGNPTGFDTNSKLFYITDQNDSLFNYDYGTMRLGTKTPSKYLK